MEHKSASTLVSVWRNCRRYSGIIVFSLALLISCSAAFAAKTSVNSIQQKYVKSVTKCEQQLKQSPDNLALRKKLASQYIKLAQSLKSDPYEAIKFLHKADLLKPGDPTVEDNLNEIIRKMGKNPLSFSDRAEIGRLARKKADFATAIGEYLQALQIQPSAAMHEQLGDIYRVRDENDKAIEQYLKAQTFGDTASLQVKLGQAYQAKKDMTNAIAAYKKAEALKSDDPLVEEALVAGWEEALRPEKKDDGPLTQNSNAHNLVDFSELSSCIKNSWTPPKRDDFKTAKLSARFSRDGRVTNLKVVSSSQDSSFDNSALKAIRAVNKSIKKVVEAPSDIDHSSVSNSTVNNATVDGSTLSIEFQHIIGGPKIVLGTFVK